MSPTPTKEPVFEILGCEKTKAKRHPPYCKFYSNLAGLGKYIITLYRNGRRYRCRKPSRNRSSLPFRDRKLRQTWPKLKAARQG